MHCGSNIHGKQNDTKTVTDARITKAVKIAQALRSLGSRRKLAGYNMGWGRMYMEHEIDKKLLLKHIRRSDLLGREKMYLEGLVQRNGWIPCRERMPEMNRDGDWSDDVLILMRRFDGHDREKPYLETFVGYYTSDARWYTMMHDGCSHVGVEKTPAYPKTGRIRRTTDEVICWMPLPEPPKGGANNA